MNACFALFYSRVTVNLLQLGCTSGLKMKLKQPLKISSKHFQPQHHYTNSPYWSPYSSLNSYWRNLFEQQDNLSSVIIFLILMKCICCSALM